ncbi:MAG: hypothetical protein K2N78_03360 [Oscillospiraceae bacterium]|nr:hypothetical protein [Oscillospiraceae bacterium]
MIIQHNKNRLQLYPVPKGAVLQEDYILRIRPVGAEEWQELKTYRVKVDMHDVRVASMAYFDFDGKVEVEITFPRFYTVYRADIRPLSLGIQPVIEPKRVTFLLDRPVNLSIEINKNRFHNLHLFAGPIEEAPDKGGKNVLVAHSSLTRSSFLGDSINRELEQMPEGRTLYVEPGIYYIGECVWHLPSHTNIYLEGGAILIGGLALEDGEDVHISGRGMVYLADFHRFSCINGLRLDHCKNVSVDGVMFVNPPHYTVALGQCEDVSIRNIKSFSCEGWSDGIDMMSCRNITVEDCFLRTSDDCVAIYGSRWDHHGDSQNVSVRRCALWADVAHPLMIGTHGDHQHDGDVIENVLFEDIDILEHHEFQPGYLGALAINAGDKNLVRNVVYKNIRIEPFEHGKVLDFQVKWNKDYNPAPGRGIENILLEDIAVLSGSGEEMSVIDGYSVDFMVRDVTIRGMVRDGKRVESLEEANIQVGSFVEDIRLE